MRHSIVPPYLLARLAQLEGDGLQRVAEAARRALVADEPFRYSRLDVSLSPTGDLELELTSDGPVRTIADAHGRETLPGTIVRREGDDPAADRSVNEAYDGLGATWDLFHDVYGRNSIDGRGLPLDASVHYGRDYDNAFWNGERMVFGDGDGEVFASFTAAASVIGHELTHGVTQYTAGLTYQGQSGALNESISDVFGVLVEQYARRQSVSAATWLIGEGIFTAKVHGRALRSMKAPGTAYDDDVLGKDPQPAHMRDYVETTDDFGGVHLNSGIPNRAFYLVAEALGGNAWEHAGQVWYDTITGTLSPSASFTDFAKATVVAAKSRYGEDSSVSTAVAGGWTGVGVGPLDE
ncbi:MAG: M4 family metallopeptidase [Rhodoglobus sp.]